MTTDETNDLRILHGECDPRLCKWRNLLDHLDSGDVTA